MVRQRRLMLYVALVAALGAVPLSLAMLDQATNGASWLPVLLYASAFGLAEATASRLRDDMQASLNNLVVLVALLDQGWAVAVLCVLGTVPVDLLRREASQRITKSTFNVAQFANAAAISSLVFLGIAELSGRSFPDNVTVLAALVAGLFYVVANYVQVGGVVAISTGEPLSSTVRSVLGILWLQVPYTGISILAAALLLAGSVGPLLLVLLFLPVFIARSGLLAFQRVDEAYDRLVRTFVTAIEVKDLYTRGHSERVAKLSVLIAEHLGIPYQERRLAGYAALLHDVGKIGVPLCIINKPGPLDDDEFGRIKEHPTIGAEILRDIDFLEPVLDIVRYHHERLDGRGYPHGIGEEELGDLVRIVTTADAFDAMTSTRSYRRALAVDEAVAELRRCADRQFDRRMVEALAAVVVEMDWEPTIEFASAHELGDAAIPTRTPGADAEPEERP